MRSYQILIGILCFGLLFSCKKEQEKSASENFKTERKQLDELTTSERLKESISKSLASQFYDSVALSDFYIHKNYQPVWNKHELRVDLFQSIENIDNEGLFPEDYHLKELQELLEDTRENSDRKNTHLEILLTDSFFKLAQHLSNGKLDPRKIYEIWGIPKNEIDVHQLLEKVISGESIEATMQSLKPTHEIYMGLKEHLQDFRKYADGDSITKVETGTLIRPGDSDPRIPSIAKRLEELGYYSLNADTTFSVYHEELQKSVKDFQEDHGLQIDALLGNTTIHNLNLSGQDRYHQILINMERWRWFPRDLGKHYILVNIPDFYLNVVRDNKIIRTHKTMVGVLSRKTPVFSDQIKYVVYNPTWTIPPTIKKMDVIPGARKDLSYLSNRNIKIYNKDRIIDPTTVDWNSPVARTYTYRQNSGSSNPLGLVKIIYPNEYLIYLHDTPSKKLFNHNARSQSSGCVRVQDALDLAAYLLSDQEKYDENKLNEILSSGKTTEIKVTQPVKVHHFYWTAEPKKDTIKFIDDIYNYDRELWNLLKPSN